MATYFLDSSALVKRHITEPGHAWVQALCAPDAGHLIVIAETAIVEGIASFCRMERERPRRLSRASRDRLIALFEKLVVGEYEVVNLTRALLTRAALLCRSYPLRAYDAIQLAAALTRRDDDLAVGNAAPVFVCADTDLLDAAQAEGFTTENPNRHP
jgi:predicted nucleic acid-binding protein